MKKTNLMPYYYETGGGLYTSTINVEILHFNEIHELRNRNAEVFGIWYTMIQSILIKAYGNLLLGVRINFDRYPLNFRAMIYACASEAIWQNPDTTY